MGILGFGKKKKDGGDEKKQTGKIDEALENVNTDSMSRKEKIALGIFKRLPKKKKAEIMQKAMNPQTIQREKGKILKQLDEAVKSGDMSKQEAELIKSQLGLR